jgi:hypothetical protein
MIYAGNAARQAASMNPNSNGSSSYGSASDWAQILSGAGQGASSAMQGATANATNKMEAKEAKRRTLANLLNQALKRNQGLFRVGQEHSDEMRDYQSQALQQLARGFIESMPNTIG